MSKSDKQQNQLSMLSLVQKLKEQVIPWREQGYKDASEKTRRLLDFWFNEDHELADGTEFKFYPAQREAIETLIYCHEILKTSNLYELNRALGEPLPAVPSGYIWPKYAFKMATGSGKTMVMALAITWAYFNDLTKNFLLIAPNLIVLDRLGTDFTDGKIFKNYPFIPPEWQSDFQLDVVGADDPPNPKKSAVLFLTNIQKLYERGEKEADNPVQDILGPKPPDDIKISIEQRREVIGRLEKLMVINDEAHHVHDEDLEWNKTIDWFNSKNSLFAQLDFSATPKNQKGEYYPHIIIDYPLRNAVSDGIVKRPKIAELENVPEIESDSAVERYKTHLEAGLKKWKEISKNFKDTGKKPVLFIMAENTNAADQVAEHLKTFPDLHDKVLVIHTDKKGEISKKDLGAARKWAKEIDSDENPFSVVVSVLMLREGWDVRNVVVVVPLRPLTAKANILPEQTLGRGLRLMWPENENADEQLILIEHPAFRHIIEEANKEYDLGLTFTNLAESYKPQITIKVDEEKLKYDLSVPVLRGGLTHSVKPLEKLRANDLSAKQLKYESLEILDVKLKKRDLLTDKIEEEEILEFPYADQPQIYLSSITKAILKKSRIPGQFDKVVPIVKEYIENYLFDKKVKVESEETLKKLNNHIVRRVLLENFVDAINALTTVLEKTEWSGEEVKAKDIKPFVWAKKAVDVKKSILNLMPVDNDFEAEIVRFFDRADDVEAFVKNDTRTLKLKIPYTDSSGSLRHYIPDFVVKTKNGMAVVETKGREDVDVQYKDKRAAEWAGFAKKLTKKDWFYLRIDQKDFENRDWHKLGDLRK